MIKDARERRANTKSKRIHCDQCDKKFNKESTFQTHMKNIHGKEVSQSQNNQNNLNQVKLTFHGRTRTLRSHKDSASAPDPNN